jgi:AcrR family transcriptional regulator
MRQPPGRAQRRGGGGRKPREERWPELIEVATEVFYEKGYEVASLQDIASRLGILKGSLYYYIQSKEDLLFDVISAVHRDGLANIQALAAGEGNALERLRSTIVGHIDHEVRNLVKTAVFLKELQALTPERQAQIVGSEHVYRGVFTSLIEAGQKEGLIRPDINPKLAALWILGSMNWVYRWFRPGGEFTARQIGEQFADMTIQGIAVQGAPLSTIQPAPLRSAQSFISRCPRRPSRRRRSRAAGAAPRNCCSPGACASPWSGTD